MTDTVGRVIQPRGIVQPADAERIRQAMAARDTAEQAVRDAVLAAAANGASVRELAALTGMSTNTIHRWKSEA